MRHPEPRGAGTGGSRAEADRRGRAQVRCGLKIPPGRPAALGGVGCRRGASCRRAGLGLRRRRRPAGRGGGCRLSAGGSRARGRGPAGEGERGSAAGARRRRRASRAAGERRAAAPRPRPRPPAAGPGPPRRAERRRWLPPEWPGRAAAAGAGSHPPLSFVRGAAAAGTVRGSAPSLRRAPLPRAVRGRAPASRRPPAAPVPAGLHFLPSPPPLFAGRRPPLTGCGLLRHCFRSRLGSRRSFILSPT